MEKTKTKWQVAYDAYVAEMVNHITSCTFDEVKVEESNAFIFIKTYDGLQIMARPDEKSYSIWLDNVRAIAIYSDEMIDKLYEWRTMILTQYLKSNII